MKWLLILFLLIPTPVLSQQANVTQTISCETLRGHCRPQCKPNEEGITAFEIMQGEHKGETVQITGCINQPCCLDDDSLIEIKKK